MSRFQKKCFIASAGFHLSLLLALLVGPAFLSSREKADPTQVIEIIPMLTTDLNVSGGGSPTAHPPAPQPQHVQPSQPTPAQPKPQEKTEPVKETTPTTATKISSDSVEPTHDKPTKRPINTQLTTRNKSTANTKPTTRKAAPTDSDPKESASRSKELSSAAQRIREGMSSGTTVEMPGPGGGGPTYANYKQTLASIYYHDWSEPDDAAVDAATVVASIVVARDGTVLSARITKSSGDKAVDRSVQATLERVKFIAPFPEGSTDQQRTFTVNFNAKAKQSLG